MLLELFLLVALVVIALQWIANYRRTDPNQKRYLQHIPIVSKIPWIGSFLVLSSFQPDNLHLKFEEFVGRFGKTFYARLLGSVVVVTADLRYVEVLLSSSQHIRKHVLYTLLHSWLGEGLLLSQGQKWHTMRKIITPTFHFKILEEFVDVFDRQSTTFIEKLRQFADGETIVDIYPHMGLLTLDIITETAMGVRINAQEDSHSKFVQAVNSVTNILATRFVRPHLAYPTLFKLFTPNLHRRQMEGIAFMHEFTRDIIDKRRCSLEKATAERASKATEEVSEDLGIKKRFALLDVLLKASVDDGQPLTDAQLQNEVNTFMFEGHDTTTSATSFCLFLLSRHPDCQQKLFEEIRDRFGEQLDSPIEYRNLQNLPYLNSVIKETLRLYPPIPAIGRLLEEDLQMEDTILGAGTNVIVLLWQVLRDPAVYDDPLVFRPERHFDQGLQASVFSNIPFSAGPRNCIGQRFALLELKTIIVKTLRHFELLNKGEEVEPSIKIVLRSKTGVQFGIKPRVY